MAHGEEALLDGAALLDEVGILVFFLLGLVGGVLTLLERVGGGFLAVLQGVLECSFYLPLGGARRSLARDHPYALGGVDATGHHEHGGAYQ